jgi:pre-mycofactocin synthase
MTRAENIMTVDDARYLAERRVPKAIADFMRSGTGTRSTLQANTEAFSEVSFRPRGAVRHDSRDLSTTVLGHEISLPVMIAPTGGGRLVHPDGERAGARAAGAAGTIQWVTTFSGTPIEDIVATGSGPTFFQLYYPGSRDAAAPLIERVAQAGCAALAVTIDSGARPSPENPYRGRVTIYRGGMAGMRPLSEYVEIIRQFGTKPSWTYAFLKDRGAGLRAAMVNEGDGPATVFRASEVLLRQTPVWADISWIKERWHGPLIVKGIMSAEDARRAVEHGADAIVVSNHGGNVLDGDPSTLSVLPEIVAEVGSSVEIFFDSGVRRGSDVVKAIALGARAVLVGRSWLWGLAAAGEPGVHAVLRVYRDQIDSTLAGLGCSAITELDTSFVRIPPQWDPATHFRHHDPHELSVGDQASPASRSTPGRGSPSCGAQNPGSKPSTLGV